MAEGAGFDLLCGAGRLGLRHAPGMPPSALGFESCSSLKNKTPPRWAEFCFLAKDCYFDKTGAIVRFGKSKQHSP